MSKKLIVPALIALAFSVGVSTAQAQSGAPATGTPVAAASAKTGKAQTTRKVHHKQKHEAHAAAKH